MTLEESMEYKEYEKIYTEETRHPPKHRYKLISELLDIKPKDKFLDVGCGFGGLVKYLRDNGIDANGVDYSPERVEYAKKEFGNYFKVASAVKLPFDDGNFDKISLIGVIGYLSEEDLIECLKEVARVLKPSGKVLITTSQPMNKLFYKIKEIMGKSLKSTASAFYPWELEKILSKVFKKTKVWLSIGSSTSVAKKCAKMLMFPLISEVYAICQKND